MPVLLERALRAIKGIESETGSKGKIARKWLGAFKGAIPEGTTSTEYLRKMRESGYGKY